MVWRAILGTILGSKSHPEIDQKSDQIFDRFWKGFGSQSGSILDQFWLQKSIKKQGRCLYENGNGHRKGSAAEAGLQGRSPTRDRDVLGLVRHICIEIIDYDMGFYKPDSTTEDAAAD